MLAPVYSAPSSFAFMFNFQYFLVKFVPKNVLDAECETNILFFSLQLLPLPPQFDLI